MGPVAAQAMTKKNAVTMAPVLPVMLVALAASFSKKFTFFWSVDGFMVSIEVCLKLQAIAKTVNGDGHSNCINCDTRLRIVVAVPPLARVWRTTP